MTLNNHLRFTCGYGTRWLGTLWLGTLWFGTLWLGTLWLGTLWLGNLWLGTLWLGTTGRATDLEPGSPLTRPRSDIEDSTK